MESVSQRSTSYIMDHTCSKNSLLTYPESKEISLIAQVGFKTVFNQITPSSAKQGHKNCLNKGKSSSVYPFNNKNSNRSCKIGNKGSIAAQKPAKQCKNGQSSLFKAKTSFKGNHSHVVSGPAAKSSRTGKLYLGSVKAARNIQLLKQLEITNVLTVSNLINTDYSLRGLPRMKHKIVSLKDDRRANILEFLEDSLGKFCPLFYFF